MRIQASNTGRVYCSLTDNYSHVNNFRARWDEGGLEDFVDGDIEP